MKKNPHIGIISSLIPVRFSSLLIMAVFACMFSSEIHAQNPKISIQGTLKTASGLSVEDGSYSVTFRLYSVETGGTHLWEEVADVEVIGGIYSHYLGSVTALNPNNFGSTLFLGVKVGSYELIPRSELAYSPYAFSVAVAQKVVCSGAVGDVKYSILNPTQFAAENGDCWVPMDGRSLETTDKLRMITGRSSVPNGGGLFIRAQDFSNSNQDPDRDHNSMIADFQGDGNKSHSHSMNSAGGHNHSVYYDSGGGGSGGGVNPMFWFTDIDDGGTFHTTGAIANGSAVTDSNGSHTHTIINDGISESRPKNMNMWVYIRIN